MSTICKLATPADAEVVASAIEQFLRDRGIRFSRKETEWPTAGEGDVFLGGHDFPSVFSLKQVTATVTEIYFNSFCTVEDLASWLSTSLGNKVVVNIYQSASEASYWGLHVGGKCLRSIEAAELEVRRHTGDRLPFEESAPGREHVDGEYKCVWFGENEQNWYNREVGVPIEIYQELGAGWLNFIEERESLPIVRDDRRPPSL